MTQTDNISEQEDETVFDEDSVPREPFVEPRADNSEKNKIKMVRIRDNRKIDPKRIKGEKRKGKGRNHSRRDWD